MSRPTFLQQVFARDPRRYVRLPDPPVDRAMEEWRRAQTPPREQGFDPKTAGPATMPAVAPSPEALGAAIGNLATHIWRAKNKMVEAKTGLPHEETKRAYRHVEAAIEALDQMEVTMQDWLDQSYDAGLPVKVLAFQPTPGLTRDMVIEAVRPAVIWKNQLLQLGEVVVGIPENSVPPDAKSP